MNPLPHHSHSLPLLNYTGRGAGVKNEFPQRPWIQRCLRKVIGGGGGKSKQG